MTIVIEVLAHILVFAGTALCLIGAIGMLRFPDVFSRMHAAGITDTLGALLVLAGLMLMAGWSLATAKLFFIFGFLWFTSPTATHALAKAALHGGERPVTADGSNGEEPSSKP